MSELGESGIVHNQEKEPRGIHVQIIDFGQRCLAMRPPLALQIAILPAAVALWLLLSVNYNNVARRTADCLTAKDSAIKELDDSRSRRCAFGSAPGRWISDTITPSTWRLLDSECPPLRWLVPSASDDAPPAGCAKPAVLLIGDSTDRMVVEAVCEKSGHQPKKFAISEDEEKNWRSLNCDASSIDIAMYPIWGVLQEGPYQEDMQGSATVRIPNAFQLFFQKFGRAPQLVVLGSLFWDISTMMLRNQTWMQNRIDMPPEYLEMWLQGADAATQKIIASIPQNTPYVWHTQHYPLHKAGKNVHWILGLRAHVTQLNAAVRVTCAKHEWCHLVDIEMMVAQWFDPNAYLKDSIHEGHDLALAVLNTYLNVLGASAGSANCTYGQDSFRNDTMLETIVADIPNAT